MYRLLCLILTIIFSISFTGCIYNKELKSTKSTAKNNITLFEKTSAPKEQVQSINPTPTAKNPPTPTPEPPPTPTPDDGRTIVAQGFFYKPLDLAIINKITGSSFPSYTQNDITYESLNYVKVLHYNFEGDILIGELIVAEDLAEEITNIFYQLYLEKYPITSIVLIDEFGGSDGDEASMTANNTSAFNYRTVSGTNKLSNHALGRAIDINPMMNPYVKDDYVSPKNGAEYADRSNIKLGMIDENDICYKLFTQNDWEWGGSWKYSKDYQHFQKE